MSVYPSLNVEMLKQLDASLTTRVDQQNLSQAAQYRKRWPTLDNGIREYLQCEGSDDVAIELRGQIGRDLLHAVIIRTWSGERHHYARKVDEELISRISAYQVPEGGSSLSVSDYSIAVHDQDQYINGLRLVFLPLTLGPLVELYLRLTNGTAGSGVVYFPVEVQIGGNTAKIYLAAGYSQGELPLVRAKITDSNAVFIQRSSDSSRVTIETMGASYTLPKSVLLGYLKAIFRKSLRGSAYALQARSDFLRVNEIAAGTENPDLSSAVLKYLIYCPVSCDGVTRNIINPFIGEGGLTLDNTEVKKLPLTPGSGSYSSFYYADYSAVGKAKDNDTYEVISPSSAEGSQIVSVANVGSLVITGINGLTSDITIHSPIDWERVNDYQYALLESSSPSLEDAVSYTIKEV